MSDFKQYRVTIGRKIQVTNEAGKFVDAQDEPQEGDE